MWHEALIDSAAVSFFLKPHRFDITVADADTPTASKRADR
jgi:hypothetical protein